ncbi:MAG TPA: Rrf2 family transcriptional regulator [Candidatus Sulfomarinibacteraceae bacterium]|nr:Rrf2 family transcriptional regulator [Candidatus Sulfomarinibacteraceae bacterium]
MMSLATHGGQMTIRELAELEDLPDTTVAKVIGRLRRASLVEAERGRNGGYTLTRPAAEMSLASVVAAFEDQVFGRDFCDRMHPGEGRCAHSASCGLKPVWHGLTAVIGNFLAGITVADLVAGSAASPDCDGELFPVVAAARG